MLQYVMNFSVHINNELVKQLDYHCQDIGISRNKLINTALKEYLERQKRWSQEIQQFTGIGEFPEISRDDLIKPDNKAIF